MLSFAGSIKKIENAESIGNKVIEIISKKDNTVVKIELPEKILFFDNQTKEDINIIIENEEIKNKDLKIIMRGKIYSIKKKEDPNVIQVSFGGLPLRLELKPELNKFKLRSDFWIGMY
ncbi:MAG: hypothetical protein EAX96_18060 [Candidatus Lokiarchaeota archaeon]|nr:hypothetical protein [Candidatus Lokiarchaeota archaeon]